MPHHVINKLRRNSQYYIHEQYEDLNNECDGYRNNDHNSNCRAELRRSHEGRKVRFGGSHRKDSSVVTTTETNNDPSRNDTSSLPSCEGRGGLRFGQEAYDPV